MFKLKSKLIVAVMVMFGITAFMSCEKDREVTNLDNTHAFLQTKQNEDFNNLALVISKALNKDKKSIAS